MPIFNINAQTIASALGYTPLNPSATTTISAVLAAISQLPTGTGFVIANGSNPTYTYPQTFHEVFSSITTLLRGMFFDGMSGASLNSCWNITNGSTGTIGPDNILDGGTKIITAATLNDTEKLDFNGKFFLDNQNSLMIFGIKLGAIVTCRFDAGMKTTQGASTDQAYCYIDSTNTNLDYYLLTGDASTNSTTDSGLLADTNWHEIKIVCSSTNVKLYIDGVLKVTKTTNLPTNPMQPAFQIITRANSILQMNIKNVGLRNL